ncbi:hypothetical protein B0T14DRAFT_400625, partial [Immersiella caudata]
MEFLSGYAAARAPLSAYQVEPLQPSSARANRPTRSNSISAGTTSSSKRRTRIHGHGHGHVRTSSASTTSSTRTETPSSPHAFAWLHAAGAVSDASSAASASASASTYGGDPAATPLLSAEREPSVLRRRDPHLQPRERMPAAGNKYYYQGYNKQLPATPRLETHPAAVQQQHFSTGNSSEPASARTPASATADPNSLDRRQLQHATMFPELGGSAKAYTTGPPLYPSGRAESISSISGATTVSTRTMLSSEPPSSAEQQLRPFVTRNGRTFISDPTLPYPLPVDLEELHRQSLRTLLLIELFGSPICCPDYADKPPKRVLEIGCGSGFWSMECFRHYQRQGKHKNPISFTGLDIAPVAPGAHHPGAHHPGTAPPTTSGTDSDSSTTPQPSSDGTPEEMKWRFVQHDLRRLPLPFRDEEFDLVMVKDMSLATTTTHQQNLIDEYLRVLHPGGVIEMWEGDHTLRMLRPHVPEATAGGAENGGDNSSDETSSGDEEGSPAQSGAYPMTANTPLSAPLNNFLVEYNSWLSKALERLQLCPVPCTLIGPLLIQESEILTGVENRRLAVPLSEVRWEREGVGGVVTKDGKSYIETKGKRGKEVAPAGQALDPGAAARRRTALLTVVQMIQSMEHVLRDVSGKSQDEWDGWLGKMMSNLVKENGTSWGECLEVGAWWARKR